MTFVLAAVMFASAGTLRWLAGWLYLAVLVASTTLPLYPPFRFDRGLLEERMSRNQPGAKPWDRIFLALIGVLTLAELVVPGLDRRWG